MIFDDSKGFEAYSEKAPISVKNFLTYTENGFYKETVFHRVINGFMVQGGGFTQDLKRKKTLAPIRNESKNGLKNEIGTLAMARTSDIDSATSQFFINVANNTFLNYRSNTPSQYGYAVFGKVIDGMTFVNKIKAIATMSVGYFSDVPMHDVIITNATYINKPKAPKKKPPLKKEPKVETKPETKVETKPTTPNTQTLSDKAPTEKEPSLNHETETTENEPTENEPEKAPKP